MHRIKGYFILSICIPPITSEAECLVHTRVTHSYTLLIHIIHPFFFYWDPNLFLINWLEFLGILVFWSRTLQIFSPNFLLNC